MTVRLLSAALVAGFLAACVASLLQFTLTSPLILRAETYEKRAEAPRSLIVLAHATGTSEGHDGHAAGEWEPGEGLPRLAFTALATLVSGIGYALLLGAALVAHGRGSVPDGALRFALGGFVAFSLAPAVGLPPELPGMEAAALGARQGWWIGTAAATAAGLYLAVVVRRPWAIAAGLALIAVPHVVGAPHPVALSAGELPAALAAQFAARSLAVALAFWVALGLAFNWAWRVVAREPAGAAA
jgi:cobalt transporter subunit CbtA